MTSDKKAWRKPIFSRLIISFICILIPVYVLSVMVYQWGISTIKENILNTMISQVSFYRDSFDKDIIRIQELEFSLLSDNNLNRLATIPESLDKTERLNALLNLRQRIESIKNSSPYIKEVEVMIPEISISVTERGPGIFDIEKYEDIGKKYLQKGANAVFDESGMFLYAAYPYPYSNTSRTPYFIVSIELSVDEVKEAMGSFSETEDEMLLFYNYENNEKIALNSISSIEDYLKQININMYINKNNGSDEIVINNTEYLEVFALSSSFDVIILKYIPESNVFSSLKRFNNWFILFLFVAVAIIIIYSYYLYKFIKKPLDILVSSFREVERGKFDIVIKTKKDNEFGYIYSQFNNMTDNLNTLIERVYKQKILVQKAEMKQLQSQINPHFLYNSFFTMNAMSQVGDYEGLEEFTEQLGEYFQFITRNSSDIVALSEEVRHARLYARIQARRYSKRIKVEFNSLPKEFEKLLVPRLIMQPILENAFEHGLAAKKKSGILKVRYVGEDNILKIVIEDNGDELSKEDLVNVKKSIDSDNDKEVTALININRRLKLKYGDKSGLEATRSNLGGLKMIIKINFTGDDFRV